MNENANRLTHYVGIGASAGGLEAIESFFSRMPENSGLAFIVVQHLSPDYKSLMVELLSKKTRIPVLRSKDGMEVKPDHIYMIPPKKNLSIFHGKLILQEKDASRGVNLPIDIFFKSLAEDKAERAIAIILSGTGSDGTRGVRAIKEQGGMVMVQDENSSKFNGMPRAAISTGLADFILPADEMPDQLMAFVGHPYVARQRPAENLLNDESGLTRIFAELRQKTKVDFTYYKPSTIIRRIERRMMVNQIDQLSEYVMHLQKYPVEVMTLYKELLIGVTSFFRNPEAMEELMDGSLSELIQQARNRELRFWVTGCSTGEEAYTIAILVKEAMERLKAARDVKIFATDLDRDAVIQAGNGIYPESIAADLTPRMLGKYFYRKEENYQIARHIREMVVFAQHNLVKDPPFTKIDMISCRNLLIYLQPVLQQKVMEMFNFSLNPGGILFLGNSETVGDMNVYFETVHQRHKIYRCIGKQPLVRQPQEPPPETGKRYPKKLPFSFRDTFRRFNRLESDNMMNRYMSVLESNFLPLSVIVNDQMDIVHVFGDATEYFKIPSGKAEFNITKMAVKDLSIPLATGIQRVFRSKESLLYANVKVTKDDVTDKITLRIIPLPDKKDHEPLVAVFFEKIRRDADAPRNDMEVYDIDEDVQQRIRDLEQELQFSNENLQATIEELETSNEELQATNEELLASNEELQSTNEELQSTNEELFTVNTEYQNKILELTEMNNDVENLLSGSGIEILILDENYDIRKCSPKLTRIFNILEKDIGRPISHLSHHIDGFDLMHAVKQVQKTGDSLTIKRTVRGDIHYLIRVLPYFIGPDAHAGTILTFVDIHEAETAKQDLRLSQDVNAQLIRMLDRNALVCVENESGDLIVEQNGGDAQFQPGRSLADIWPAAGRESVQKQIRQVKASGSIGTMDSDNGSLPDGADRLWILPLPGNRFLMMLNRVEDADKTRAG